MTCAHVINTAVGRAAEDSTQPTSTVGVIFPFSECDRPIEGKVVLWLPMGTKPVGDIAVLEFDEDLPADVGVVRFARVEAQLEGVPLMVFGYRAGGEQGNHVSIRLMGATSPDRVQIDGTSVIGAFIQGGYSGAAVWDTSLRAVQGMVSAVSANPTDRIGYMIPFSVLEKVWPRLSVVDLHLGQLFDEQRRLVSRATTAGFRAYLDCLIEEFRWLQLQGISQAGTLQVELEKVYVALKAEPRNDYDRQQEAELHSAEVSEAAGVSSLDMIDPEGLEQLDADNTRRTYRPGREEAKWLAVTEVRTVADAFRQYRRMTILGGPGSGKTTLGRWLCLQFARGLARELDGGKRFPVAVPVSQIDPDPGADQNPDELVELGPARLPVFLRIAHYARELAERNRQHRPSLLLVDYLGQDPDSEGRRDGCDAAARNRLIRSALEAGNAVVVLDGLDELPEANRRAVVMKIQEFVEKYARASGAGEADAPWQTGGNQVVITSRYVGYGFAPVRADCAHFGIQAMRRPAVERFAHSWTDAVNAKLALAGQLGLVAEALIAEIYNEARPAVRELATNPLLVTILATVYLTDKRLPDQRAGVYDRVVENLLTIWLNREECLEHRLKREELLAALEPLAAELQQNATSNGLISLDRIGEVIEKPLARMRGKRVSDRAFVQLKDDLLKTISKQVGLLAEQSVGNYAFFHRTFQEFIAARHLLAPRKRAAEKICERLDDPRWREPLLLALGFAMISHTWGPVAREQLLTEILAADGPDAMIPRSAFLIVTALPDLRQAPAGVVGGATVQLLNSFAISLDQPQAASLREQIERTFVRLREGTQADAVASQVAQAIRRPPAGRDLSWAAAALLRRIDWFTTELVDALLKAIPRDRADHDWPIRRALLAALAHRPAAVPWLGPAPILQMYRLGTLLPMRRLLESDLTLVAFVRRDLDWTWLLVALYGGLPHLAVLDRYDRLLERRVLRTEDVAAYDPMDESGAVERLVASCPIHFSPHDVARDLEDPALSQKIREHLTARQPAGDLACMFESAWSDDSLTLAGRAEALVGLAALGRDVMPDLQAALADPDRQAVARAAIARFGWLRSYLREPLVRTSEVALRTIPGDLPEAHQLDLLAVAQEVLLASGAAPIPISDRIPDYRFVDARTPAGRATLDAEHWSYLFAGTSPSGGRSGEPSVGWHLLRSSDRLMHAWSLLPCVRNHEAIRRHTWPQAILSPRADTPVERYLALLESMATVPSGYLFVAGTVLKRCQAFLGEHPDLWWETLALLWSQGEAFRDGFRSASPGFAVDHRLLDALATAGVPGASLAAISRLKGQVFDDRTGFLRHVAEVLDPAEREAVDDLLRRHTAGPMPDDADPSRILPQEFLSRVSAVADPYLRFRAELCFLIYVLVATRWAEPRRPSGDAEEETSPNAESMKTGRRTPQRLVAPGFLRSLDQIGDPHARVRAGEWILQTTSIVRSGFGRSVVESAALIDDAENRARAQCRLAFLLPEYEDELLRAGIESLGRISDAERRVGTIREVRRVWGMRRWAEEALDAAARELPDPWLRDKALGRTSRLAHAYRHRYATGSLAWRLTADDGGSEVAEHRIGHATGSVAWGLVYLGATAAEVEALSATAMEGGQLTRLLAPERPVAEAGGRIGRLDVGVQISAREASMLDRVIQAGDVADLEHLWPFLERPTPEAQATIHRWSARSDHAGRWSALVQAEAGRLSPDVVGAVIDLLETSTDRLHMRAALALHGRHPFTQNPGRRWSVQRVGGDTLEVVARRYLVPNCPPSARSALFWVHHDVHHDDTDAIRHWLDRAAEESPESSPAAWILGGMESASTESVPLLLGALEGLAPRAQRVLLSGLARLSNCCTALDDAGVGLCGPLSAIPREVRHGLCVLRNGPVTLLEIARNVTGRLRASDRISRARSILESELLTIDDACLSSEAAALARLRAVGNRLYVRIDTYWSDASAAAAEVKDPAEVLDFLLEWLDLEQRAPGPAKIIPDLLTATEAVARRSPPAFARVATPEDWEPFLTESVRSEAHWTARQAAVRLLGRLRRVSDRVVVALQSAMNDVSYVQMAAYEAACEFRRVDADILSDLFGLLDDRCAGVAAATIRLLTGIARAECEPADRRRILRHLREAAGRPIMDRPVYLMEETGLDMKIQFSGRLDRILYAAISEIGGW